MTAMGWTKDPGHCGYAHRLVLAGGIFTAVLGFAASNFLIAPSAHALSEQEIQQICGAKGGTYNTGTDQNGHTYSTCCYYDLYGQHCDQYLDGEYQGTYRQAPPETTTAPVPRPRPVGPGPLPGHS
ncbi:hypothetical protein [Mycobacterium noviomagense]|uniref:Uncharacterized protein n=1 Tax=Mycobacterium noviomagense TaxID=459858 RepID=A0A7I7PEA7_9MYCO|nr:hypothetical protein [Mycobacterium noviomagense]BBY06943.1 hypothetical protein MNVI_22610 [Mycobacterium noviomagense]